MTKCRIPALSIAIVTVAITVIVTAPRGSAEHSVARGLLGAITIHQEIDFKVSPQRVYEALLDAKQFSAFSGLPAEISREAGGSFSLFGGHIVGRNLELVANRRIVQGWRPVDWPEGLYSIARFELKAQGSGTHLIFDHTAFPEDLRDHLAEGWESHYWGPLKKYLR